MGYTWSQLNQNTWSSLNVYTWGALQNAPDFFSDTKQIISRDTIGNTDMKVVLYLNTSLNADSKQVIILNKEVLSDSKQIIYANHEKYVDTKFVISAYKTYYTDSAQILYLLKEIVVDSFQLTSILSQMIFTGEISPGQTLRIDTEKMEALVDNLLANNALDKFIELEPGTNFIVIQDDTGNVLVNIEIEYKDRWL